MKGVIIVGLVDLVGLVQIKIKNKKDSILFLICKFF